MILVRPAETRDVPWLLDQLQAFSAFYGTKRPLFAGEHARATIPRWVEMPDAFPIFVAEDGGAPAGFIAGAIHPHLFDPALLCLSELFWPPAASRAAPSTSSLPLGRTIPLQRPG
jgi:hypothetical protein